MCKKWAFEMRKGVKSKIFRDNWNIYKEKLSGPPIRRYMENNFGI